MIETILISLFTGIALLAIVGLIFVWQSPESIATRLLLPVGNRLQPSRGNRALIGLVLALVSTYHVLSISGFDRASLFVLGASYPVSGLALYRIWHRM